MLLLEELALHWVDPYDAGVEHGPMEALAVTDYMGQRCLTCSPAEAMYGTRRALINPARRERMEKRVESAWTSA